MEVLREAGVLAPPSGQRRKSAGSSKNHILFAETQEEGESCVMFTTLHTSC